jgi:hypothetical protein
MSIKKNPLSAMIDAISKDENLLRGHASKKCDDCYGKGFIEVTHPKEEPQKYICHCVVKKAKKIMSEI